MIKPVDKERAEAIFSEFEASERAKHRELEQKEPETDTFTTAMLLQGENPGYYGRNPPNRTTVTQIPAIKIRKTQPASRQCPINTRLPRIKMPRGPRVRGGKR